MACATKPAPASLFPKGWHDKVGPESKAATTASSNSNSSSIIQNISSKLSLGSSSNTEQAQDSTRLRLQNLCLESESWSINLQSHDSDVLRSVSSTRIAVKSSSESKWMTFSKGEAGKKIEEYSQSWITTNEDLLDPSSNPEADEQGYWNKLEELIWFNTLLLGATCRPNKNVKHDFFLMHCNNSLLFLPTLLPVLSKKSRSILLHAHLRVSLFYWIARGRPLFHIDQVLMKSTENPVPEIKKSKDQLEINRKLFGDENEKGSNIGSYRESNPWYGLMDLLQHHNDEHLVKAIRALSYWNTRLSSIKAGTFHLQEEALNALSERVVETSKEKPDGDGEGEKVGLNDFSLYKGLEAWMELLLLELVVNSWKVKVGKVMETIIGISMVLGLMRLGNHDVE
ncbi:hypothetical protein L7F22_023102 [Adiantum nelumboides]|nr:hypothetical protein [Adiantum nelumboides]